jgi:hypothetical protein
LIVYRKGHARHLIKQLLHLLQNVTLCPSLSRVCGMHLCRMLEQPAVFLQVGKRFDAMQKFEVIDNLSAAFGDRFLN